MEQRRRQKLTAVVVSYFFVSQSPYLKGYSEYCRNYEYALSYFDRLQASTPLLAQFIQVRRSTFLA